MEWLKKIRERRRERQERKEVQQARYEGLVRGIQFRGAKLRIVLLDQRLALAVACGDEQWAQEIAPRLQVARDEYQKLLAEEAAENERLADLIQKLKETE
ncbi:MAG: hypothetical protein WB780_21220 [Candidatus Acidiferrales bacterium]